MDPAKYELMRHKLFADGVGDAVAQAWGFNSKNMTEMEAARSVLKEVGHNKTLVWHLRGLLSVCNHASPTRPLHWGDLVKDLTATMPVYNNLDDLYRSGQRKRPTECSNSTMKTIAAAAAHVNVWKKLADGSLLGSLPPRTVGSEDGWYLVVEDDVEFCPGWMARLREELLLAPADADVLKMSWVGRWNNKSSVGPFLEAPDDPYEGLTNDWMRDLMGKAFKPGHGLFKELLGRNTLKTFSLSVFFGGAQAYLLRRSSLPKLMQRLNGMRFDYTGLTLQMIGKTYAWRRVLAVEDGVRSRQLEEEARMAAKQLKKEEAKKAKESRKRRGKEDSKLALISEGHASVDSHDSIHVSLPMCGKEPEDPADAGKRMKRKQKRKVQQGATGQPAAANP